MADCISVYCCTVHSHALSLAHSCHSKNRSHITNKACRNFFHSVFVEPRVFFLCLYLFHPRCAVLFLCAIVTKTCMYVCVVFVFTLLVHMCFVLDECMSYSSEFLLHHINSCKSQYYLRVWCPHPRTDKRQFLLYQ